MAPLPVWADDTFAHSFIEEAQLVPGAQTRPNLKIQEGCSNRCTFCVIPQTRGGSRSLSADAVMRQVDGFVASGGIELVLSGINLGRWGRDLPSSVNPPRTLAALICKILATSGSVLPRLRLSSIEPMDWDAGLIALMVDFGNARIPMADDLARHASSAAAIRVGRSIAPGMHRRYRPMALQRQC